MLDRPLYREVLRQSVFRHGKMAFITGPRQVGKTTLARGMGAPNQQVSYHTWDDPEFRRQWIKDPKALVEAAVGARSLLVLDELHKAPRWKSHLKGLYDLRGEFADIIVTGSARLDLFRRGGDSLMGRYFLVHLHPFTVGELRGGAVAPDGLRAGPRARDCRRRAKSLQALLAFGGFPEPLEQARARVPPPVAADPHGSSGARGSARSGARLRRAARRDLGGAPADQGGSPLSGCSPWSRTSGSRARHHETVAWLAGGLSSSTPCRRTCAA